MTTKTAMPTRSAKTMDISKTPGYGLHGDDCLCVKCLLEDMDRHAMEIFGFKPSERYADDTDGKNVEAVRTRYATPGTSTGRGVVRKVSAAQVRYMKSLLTQRDTTNLVRLPGSEDIENMSLAGARDLIERLLACPEKKSTPVFRPATEPMKNFLRKLLAEKSHDMVIDIEAISFDVAKYAIDTLKNLPKAFSGVLTEDGMYLKDGMIYKVQRAVHGSGELYAKMFNVGTKEFDYVGRGPLHKLTVADKMTVEQASEFSVLYEVCIRCAKVLTRESSIAQGMGDTCASKM